MPSNDPIPMEITCAEVKSRLDAGDDFLLLDCRELEEHTQASIAEAKLLPMSQWSERVGELEDDRAREIVVHCHAGGRSLHVVQWLRENGFPTARSMAGGIDLWSVEIDPTVPRY